jgi:hypothetical protein
MIRRKSEWWSRIRQGAIQFWQLEQLSCDSRYPYSRCQRRMDAKKGCAQTSSSEPPREYTSVTFTGA